MKVCLEGERAGQWADFGGIESGDMIGLWKAVKGVDVDQAKLEAMGLLGITNPQPSPTPMPTQVPSESWARLQKKLRKGTETELKSLAELRHIPSIAGLELATKANQLFFADVWDDGFDYPAWIITDDSRINAQARRMDGKVWDGIDGKKCKTIHGCKSKWPVGLHGVNGHDIAFVEGSPDLLAAWHCIWLNGKQDTVSPVAMFGSFSIDYDAIPLFRGKRIFAFPHNDSDGKGEKTMDMWSDQLKKSGAESIDRFDFKPSNVKDLNDLVAIDDGATVNRIKEMFITAMTVEALKDIDARRISICNTPPEPVTRLFLAGKPIATPGNIQTLISKAKTGKTATIGATVAAIIAAITGRTDLDTLGFTAPNPEGKAVIVIDTEQSIYDAFLCYQRSLKRADIEKDPEWLYHYALVGYPSEKIKESLVLILEKVSKKHNGVFFIILDGVADLVLSVNDEAESKTIVTKLRALCVQYDTPMLTVIHSNEAAKSGDDGRGHLGKELTRKAESNLLLKKSGETTVITSEKQRKAPITEEDGVAFKWSNADGRHVSCGSNATNKLLEKKEALHDLANSVFKETQLLSWKELKDGIKTERDVSENTAQRKVQEMITLGVVKSSFSGKYQRVA